MHFDEFEDGGGVGGGVEEGWGWSRGGMGGGVEWGGACLYPSPPGCEARRTCRL